MSDHLPAMVRVAPADAWYLNATNLHTDQLLVYGFAGSPPSVEPAVEEVLGRARSCPELRLRVGGHRLSMGLPAWVPCEVSAEQVVVHASGDRDWSGCLKSFGELIDQRQLDPRQAVWRLHVFVGVHGVPASPGRPSTVAVLQISHAFADGTRAAALAGVMFGRTAALPPITAAPARGRASRGIDAVRHNRQLARDTGTGRIPPAPGPVPALSVNEKATGARIVRTFVRHRMQLPGRSATVGALVAISEALSGYLRERGEDPSALTALVPMAKHGVPQARNHSGPEFIGLHPDVRAKDERARLIATELSECQRRRQHPAFVAQALALEALPWPLQRWVSSRANPLVVMAHTVVSSVNRGAADLSFGGCPVIMTAGYPFASPTIGLTHGVHGIGDMVGISVNTTESITPHIDDYLDRLNAALGP
ncbi:MAG: WS/DGAT domain-containing protein [Mycobacterium sp.]